jgi:hypothetical protein
VTTYNVTAGKVGAQAKTLVANTEDVVTFADNIGQARLTVVAVAAGSSAPLYVTGDGTTATVAGDNTRNLAAVVGAELLLQLDGATDQVRLISAGAHTYSVERG